MDNILKLHNYISAILRVVSSIHRKIDLGLFEKHCVTTSLFIAENFPWVQLNHTLHGLIQHSCELIAINGGYGLGELSEEGLESNNKDIRKFLELLSRKNCPVKQLHDVMSRLLERSHPLIVQRIADIRPKKHCTQCHSTEHTVRAHNRIMESNHAYDVFVEQFFIEDDQ